MGGRRRHWLLVATAVTLLVAAFGPTVDGVSLNDTTWLVTGINGREPPDGRQPTLRFHDGQISGEAICNGYGSTNVTIASHSITIGNLGMQAAGCGDPSLEELERTFLAALSSATTIRLNQITSAMGGPATLLVIAGPEGELILERSTGPLQTLR